MVAPEHAWLSRLAQASNRVKTATRTLVGQGGAASSRGEPVHLRRELENPSPALRTVASRLYRDIYKRSERLSEPSSRTTGAGSSVQLGWLKPF